MAMQAVVPLYEESIVLDFSISKSVCTQVQIFSLCPPDTSTQVLQHMQGGLADPGPLASMEGSYLQPTV